MFARLSTVGCYHDLAPERERDLRVLLTRPAGIQPQVLDSGALIQQSLELGC